MQDDQIQEILCGALLPDWAMLPDFGLYMDQLVTYVEKCFSALQRTDTISLTPAMINNYVKCGLIDRPRGKKYTRDSLAQLLMVCQLKQTTSLDTMKRLLHPEGGASTESMYHDFRAAQDRITSTFASLKDHDPLMCALEAASYQLICRLLLTTPDTQPSPET